MNDQETPGVEIKVPILAEVESIPVYFQLYQRCVAELAGVHEPMVTKLVGGNSPGFNFLPANVVAERAAEVAKCALDVFVQMRDMTFKAAAAKKKAVDEAIKEGAKGMKLIERDPTRPSPSQGEPRLS